MRSAFFRLCLPKFADVRVAQLLAAGLGRREGFLRALCDPVTLFLGDGRMNVQHEGIHIRAQFGDDEGTRCTIKPLMKCTSRLSRSSLAIMTGAALALPPLPSLRAVFMAAASSGRRTSASAPLPVSTSRYSASIL
jgi:hypothetical protein